MNGLFSYFAANLPTTSIKIDSTNINQVMIYSVRWAWGSNVSHTKLDDTSASTFYATRTKVGRTRMPKTCAEEGREVTDTLKYLEALVIFPGSEGLRRGICIVATYTCQLTDRGIGA